MGGTIPQTQTPDRIKKQGRKGGRKFLATIIELFSCRDGLESCLLYIILLLNGLFRYLVILTYSNYVLAYAYEIWFL